MNIIEIASIVGIAVIGTETTYLTWRSMRSVSANSRFDHPILVDTSVLMDGRIVGIAKTGFITGELVIPRSVILELQLLADKADHDKRERARFGLDVVAKLQQLAPVRVRLFHDDKAKQGVDERLLELARDSQGIVLTLDYNLQKVAATENITCLNINELAQQLRLERLPGERLRIDLVDKGSDSHQAVGYLNDGTMVVVEHASSLIGKTETIEIIRSLQTVSGRMCFAKIVAPVYVSKDKKQAPKLHTKTTRVASGRKPSARVDTTAKNVVIKDDTQTDRPRQQSKRTQTNTQRAAKNATIQPESTTQQGSPRRQKTSRQREASLLQTIEDQAD